ncbi:MAG: CocE/NonD family hydrolase [Anaerocolumna sp.]
MDNHDYMKEVAAGIKKQYGEVSYPVLYKVKSYEEIMLPMSDGIKLRTRIYKPDTDVSRLPVVIQRCCYPQNELFLEIHGNEYAKRGFAFVYQYCRGTGGSEGIWEPNENERKDGIDMLTWLCKEDWVDSVGYWGSSYLALTGWSIIDAVPEKVKTMYLTQYGTDRFTSAYKDGLFRHDVLTSWAMGNAGFPVAADYMESCKYHPHVEVDEKLWGGRLDWYRNWVTATEATDDYWQTGFWKMLKSIPEKVTIPIYLGEGWHDHHLASALKTYDVLAEASRNQSTLRIGAWNHMFMPCLNGHECNNLENNDSATAMDWFYQLLIEKEIPRKKVLTYIIGEDRWKEWDSFPITTSHKKRLYLSGRQPKSKLYELTETKTADEIMTYIYDPENPVMSLGGDTLLCNIDKAGSVLQPECGFREDVLSYVSKEFKEGLLIAGKMNCHLYVSSSAEDTAFSVKIMEVFKDGRAFHIRNGITTLGFRNKAVNRQEYMPGSIEEIEIEILDITWKLQAGSKLRLDVSSSNFPEYTAHTNYKGVWALQEKVRKADQTIYVGENYPSYIELPY